MDNINHPFFEIQSQDNYLRVYPQKYIFAEQPSIDEFSQNWLEAKVEFRFHSFHANFSAKFMTADFERFKQELRKLYKLNLHNRANFHCYDSYLLINMKGQLNGEIFANVELSDDGRKTHNFEFEMDLVRSQLPEIINQLNIITQSFPIKGSFFSIENKY